MKKQPLVSILLSIYKVEEYLEECLDSILAQSYKNLEIVCVNNGSPDKCGDILKKYAKKDKRIKVVTLKENKMLCGGRNAGLDNATGDFICFVDPDDWIEKDHIKAMVDTILTKKDPEGKPYNLVMNTNAYNYYGENRQIFLDYNRQEKSYSIDEYNKDETLDTGVPMWGRLYRKSFLDNCNIRFSEGTNLDNIPFTLKLWSRMKYCYIISKDLHPNSAYWRRLITPDGALTPVILFQNMEIPACLENLYDYLKKYGLERKVRVMYHRFFKLCFPRHKDMPKYYVVFKNLMIKMEDDIKSAPEDVYPKYDRDLCNLLIYTDNFFQFAELYFKPLPKVQGKQSTKIKFCGIPILKIKFNPGKQKKYFLFSIPVLSIRYKQSKIQYRLFCVLPILTIQTKEK